jgi:hypothetical protein
MTTLRTSIIAGLAILAAVVLGSLSAAMLGSLSAAQAQGPVQSAAAPNGLPVARCSRPLDQEAVRIKQLIEFVQKSRAMAETNPLLLADVGYYEAELAASRRCLQSVAAR